MPSEHVVCSLLASIRSRAWLRFGLAGVVNAGFGYSVFAFLVLAGIWPGVALVLTMIVAIAFNFQTSRRFVFQTNGRILRFIVVYGVVLALNWASLTLLRWRGFSDLGAQAVLTLPIAAVAFLGQQHFVFSPEAGST